MKVLPLALMVGAVWILMNVYSTNMTAMRSLSVPTLRGVMSVLASLVCHCIYMLNNSLSSLYYG